MTATGGKVKRQKKQKQSKCANVGVDRKNSENIKSGVSKESEYYCSHIYINYSVYTAEKVHCNCQNIKGEYEVEEFKINIRVRY